MAWLAEQMWNLISSRTKGGDFGKNVREFQPPNVRHCQGGNDARLVGSNFRDPQDLDWRKNTYSRVNSNQETTNEIWEIKEKPKVQESYGILIHINLNPTKIY